MTNFYSHQYKKRMNLDDEVHSSGGPRGEAAVTVSPRRGSTEVQPHAH